MQHVRDGKISLWQLQSNKLADEQAKNGSALHPCVAHISNRAVVLGLFLGLVG